MLFVAGAASLPRSPSVYAMVDRVAPAGAVTEGFAWLNTAVAMGGAAGRRSAGVADGAGPSAAFALAGGAGAVAVLVTLPALDTLAERRVPRAAAWSAAAAPEPVAPHWLRRYSALDGPG